MKKKLVMAAVVAVTAANVHAWVLEVDNDTNHSVEVCFMLTDKTSHKFTLAPHREKKIRRIPRNVHVTEEGIHVMGVSGKAEGQEAMFMPTTKGRNVDVEIKMDRKGKMHLKKDLL